MSTETGVSKRATRPATTGTTRSSSSGSVTSGPGPALTPPISRMSAPVGDQLLGPRVELVELEGGALVVEGVGRAVEDPHHEGPVGEVVAAAAEVERRGERGDGRAVRRRRCRSSPSALRWPARPSEQARGQRPPVLVGARVVGAHRLEEVDELLAGGVVVAHPVEQLVELGRDLLAAGARDVDPGLEEAGLGGQGPAGVGLGEALQQGQRLGGVAAVDQQAGQRLGGAGVVRLELERPAQRRLVPGLDQRVGLARGRAPGAGRTR